MEKDLMVVLGIDPDAQFAAIAWADKSGPQGVCCIPFSKNSSWEEYTNTIKNILDAAVPYTADLIIIEGQQIYPGSKVQPNSLIKLATISGLWAQAACNYCHTARILIPKPREWKGSIDKATYQARLYRKLGWGYEKRNGYSIPLFPSVGQELSASMWKHIGDAIGLAMWGLNLK